MAQQQANVNIAEVGFNGLNTEDSPITQDASYASVADNCVIDAFGRIGSRQAFAEETDTLPTLPAIPLSVTEKIVIDTVKGGTINGTVSVICTARNIGYDASGSEIGSKGYVLERVGSTLVEVTLPAGISDTTLETCSIVVTDDRYYIMSEGNEVMIWDGSTLTLISDQVGYIGIQNTPAGAQVEPEFTHGIAAYGRIWSTGHLGDMNTLYYSDLLIGASNYTVDGIDPLSTAGKLNVLESWPNGKDSIVALGSHNNRLIIFGRNSILVYNAGYGDPADPSSGFTLEDTISNVGCIGKDATVSIGTDLLFVDDTGIRSLGRTIQERSSPMGNLTNKVRGDISRQISQTIENHTIHMEYDIANNLVVCLFSEANLAYALDMKSYNTAGLAKVTRWTDCIFTDMTFFEEGNSPSMLLAGSNGTGLLKYDTYNTVGSDTYITKYYTNQLTFGEPARSKFLKQIDYTIISSFAPAIGFAKWGYDSINTYKSKRLLIDAESPEEFTVAEYNIAEYGEAPSTLRRYKVNTSGSGEAVKVGIEIDINGNSFSLQELNIQTLIGRII